jgi:O-antigen ligase
VAALAILFMVPAMVLSLDRSAWLAAAVGAAFYAALLAAASLQPKFAAALALLFLLLLTAVTTNLVGVNVLREVCVIPLSPGQTCPDWARRLEELSLRGGGGLSGRQFLWSASWDAIKARPVSGYGPGTDVIAIQPYLHGPGLTYLGLSSHSTWLRAGVEMGLPGLVLLIAVIAASGLVFVRRLKLGPPTRPRALRASNLPTGWGGESVELVWPALLAGMLPAMTFEAFLLGGVTLSSLYLALALGMMAIPSVASTGDRAFSRAPSAATPAAATV